MGNVRVVMNSRGARALLNSEEVQALLLEKAEAIRVEAESQSGAVFDADVQAGRNRAHAMVKTTDFESRLAQARSNVLLKSIDAGR